MGPLATRGKNRELDVSFTELVASFCVLVLVPSDPATTQSSWELPEVAQRKDRKSLPFLPEGRR